MNSIPDDTVYPNEGALVHAAQAGDEQAMECLLHRYTFLVRAKARTYFLLGADAEDVYQEGMIGLFKAIRDFDGTRGVNFSSFATLCITRQIITAVKTASRLKHVPLNGYVSLNKPVYEEESRSLEELLSAAAPGPEDILVRNEVVQEFRQGVSATLSPFEIQVLALYLEGVPFSAIAQHVNKGYKSVDNAVWRIRRKLRQMVPAQGA